MEAVILAEKMVILAVPVMHDDCSKTILLEYSISC
jgi:hypothetical protein